MRQIGKTKVTVSDIIFGCWQMGGDYWGEFDTKNAEETVRYAMEKGITTFDTAYCYGKGRSEELLGNALAGCKRENYQLISKLWMTSLRKNDAIKACEDSLKRLNVDCMDVYFIHYPDPAGEIPISETMEALMHLKESGKIKSIGVSNFSLQQIKEAQEHGTIDIIQPCYSLLWRFIDKEILPFCLEKHIGIMGYSPLAQGLLSGSYGKDDCPKDGRSYAALFHEPYYSAALKVTEYLKKLADTYNTTAGNLALNWVLEKDGITAPIVGIRQKRHVDESLKALDIRISPEDKAELEKISRQYMDTLPHFKSFFGSAVEEREEKIRNEI